MDLTLLSGGLAPGSAAFWMPLVCLALMAVAVLAYALLDGLELGVGVLLRIGRDGTEREAMLATLGSTSRTGAHPWLLLMLALLLGAFPQGFAWLLRELAVLFTVMALGLMARAAALTLRDSAEPSARAVWDNLLWAGSLLTAVAQGAILAALATGLDTHWHYQVFYALAGLCMVGGYALLGASWLGFKLEGRLRRRVARWGRYALWATVMGLAGVAVMTLLTNLSVLQKWFSLPWLFYVAPLPVALLGCVAALEFWLRRQPVSERRLRWLPVALVGAIFALGFFSLAYSLFPYLVVGKMTVWQGAASPETLSRVLWVAAVAVPLMLVHAGYRYWVLWRKAAG